ncbi:siderophore ferric iron reductase [Vibrio quintilis]|uniref:Ferric siderophore reductase C-terminal domain-containing protein n=1 Tax=Vibrio quintilis TaxID=1117707 RepID=A0A1M7YUK7_9VIBR|nr:siderophore ferric iron reductase [Vibrio quintilis]SHO56329.1 hypothetical protein VQ7734_02098 [Vibrio quintilis]
MIQDALIRQDNIKLFDTLNQLGQSITPYLRGELVEPLSQYSKGEPQACSKEWPEALTTHSDAIEASSATKALVTGAAQDLAVIQQLHQGLKTVYPEASPGYRVIRSWDLLTWQPLYLSMIGIYGMQRLPDLSGLKQYVRQGGVMGYALDAPTFWAGDPDALIIKAGAQLKPLFAHYRAILDRVARCRQGMTRQLVADAILANLAKLQWLDLPWEADQIRHQAALWLKAMSLPASNLASYDLGEDGRLHLTRRSCCLVYQTKQGELCADCPRLKKRQVPHV